MADRVVHKLLSNNRFHDGDDNPAVINDDVNTNQTPDEDEHEFEFPIIHEDANSRQISTEFVSDDQISPRYPLFDRSLLSDVDLNLCNGIAAPKTDNKQSPATATATRASLIKLFNEDRDIDSVSTSPSSSEADELDGIAPGTYCVWKPKTKTDLDKRLGKHKKSNSMSIGNTSNRWKVRDLLKRSYSDDNYSAGKDSPVFLFIPPISPEKVNNNNNNNNKSEKTVKTERRIPAYKSKIGNIRLPPYLPYRPDQLAAYANFTGPNRNIYRC